MSVSDKVHGNKGRKHRLGTRHSEETKRKMIDSRKDTEEWKRKMSEASKRENLSEETRRKMSKVMNGRRNQESLGVN